MNPNSIQKAVNDAVKVGFDPVRLEKSLQELAALNASGDYRKNLYIAGRFSFGVITFRLNLKFSREQMAFTGYEARFMGNDQVPARHWEFNRATPLAVALKVVIKDLCIAAPKPIITELLTGVTTPQISLKMNLNNLQDLKREVKDLGFNPNVADDLEKNMRTNTTYFTLKDTFPGDTGQVDMTLHFNKSKESDFYSFRKFEAAAGKIPLPTVENQQYMVLVADKNNPEQPSVNPFENPNDALDFFKKQKGNSELVLGDSAEGKQLLASTENGKVNYVNDDFSKAFHSSGIKQNFYLSNGTGFTASQAVNMVQGRTVHRENMINPKNGDVYNAWIKLDVSLGKDDYGNLKLKQMNDPNFGFNLEKTLDTFKIKELADPAKKAEVISAMKNGDRVVLTAVNKENKEVKILAEAVPQYKTLDFYKENGSKERRELYKKPDVAEQSQGKSQGKSKDKELEETKSMSIR